MIRTLALAGLLALPAAAAAQIGTPLPSGPASFGGGFRFNGPPIASGPNALWPLRTVVPSRFGVGGGALSGYPQAWLPSGPWGGVAYPWPFVPTYNFVQPIPVPVQVPVPAATAPARTTEPLIDVSGTSRATLVLQFPAAAEVWVDGKKGDGDATTEWTLTSPILNAGEKYTFDVTGRWKSGGKAFESQRTVAVAAGDRSRVIVLSGTEIKE